jgi:hypothetical protein
VKKIPKNLSRFWTKLTKFVSNDFVRNRNGKRFLHFSQKNQKNVVKRVSTKTYGVGVKVANTY